MKLTEKELEQILMKSLHNTLENLLTEGKLSIESKSKTKYKRAKRDYKSDILEILKHGDLDTLQLKDKISGSEGKLYQAIRELVEEGKISKTTIGKKNIYTLN